MTFDERVKSGKPYLTGFILGLIAAPIIAFSAGWVSTSGARATAVENARIETLADLCSGTAGRLAAAQNTDITAVKGYDNRVKREELVAAAMAEIQMPEDLVKAVANSCNRTLA
jgi:hypothetical protein